MKHIANWLSEHEPILRAAFRIAALGFLWVMAANIIDLRKNSPSWQAVQDIQHNVDRIERDASALREKLAPR